MKITSKTHMVFAIICACSLVFILGIFSCFLYLKAPFDQYQNAKYNYTFQKNCLLKKRIMLSNEKIIIKSLHLWQQKNPTFYTTIQSSFTLNQLLEQLTDIAKNNEFSVTEIKPLLDKNKSRSHHVELKISGSFQKLFLFISEINASAYPISLDTMTISHDAEFDLQLALRGASD